MITPQADNDAAPTIAPQAQIAKRSSRRRLQATGTKTGCAAEGGPAEAELAMVVMSQSPETSMLASKIWPKGLRNR
jgi:hypothetical protein